MASLTSSFSLQSITNLSANYLCEEDCDLKLFQSTMDSEVNKSLKRAVDLINIMVELNYITNEDNQLRFTSPGIEYMNSNYHKFINDINLASLSNGPCSGLVDQLQEIAGFEFKPIPMSQTEKFQRENQLINLGDGSSDGPDYNNYNNYIPHQKEEGDVIWPTE